MMKFKKLTFGNYRHSIKSRPRSISDTEKDITRFQQNHNNSVAAEHSNKELVNDDDTLVMDTSSDDEESSESNSLSQLNVTEDSGLQQLVKSGKQSRPLRRKRLLPPGLCNNGNLCFLNSTLQALASLPSFVASVNRVSKNNTLSLSTISSSPISASLSNVLKLLNCSRSCLDLVSLQESHRPKAVDPSILADLIRKHQYQTSFKSSARSSIIGSGGILQEQQDAQEMLQALVQALGDECSEVRSRSRRSLTLSDAMTPPPSVLSTSLMVEETPTITPASVIGGWHGTSIECQRCGVKRPISNVPFSCVTLSLSELPDCPVSIESCVEALTAPEWLKEVECDRCTVNEQIVNLETSISLDQQELDRMKKNKEEVSGEVLSELSEQKNALNRLKSGRWHETCLCGKSCLSEEECLVTKVRSSVSKRLLFSRLPPVLILHLNRQEFCPHSGASRKSKQKVVFGLELDMSPYCAFGGRDWRSVATDLTGSPTSPRQTRSVGIMYELCAVIQHHGGAVGGHYTTYRKVSSDESGEEEATWVHASDLDVEEVSISKVLSCEAYLLFYERKSES
jgi:ubiquitin C-terminal hydrolase